MTELGDISVIIPTYNRAKLLVEAILSAEGQKRLKEIIVVDDGSTDETRETVLGRFPFVRYLWQNNMFLGAARNTGGRAATGNYLLFLDSDDQLLPNALSLLADILDNAPDSPLVYGEAVSLTGDALAALPVAIYSDVDDTDRLVRDNYIRSAGCVLIRKKCMIDAGDWDTRLRGVEDWDMWLRLSILGNFKATDVPVLRYRVHSENMSANTQLMNRSSRQLTLKHSGWRSPIRKKRRSWNSLRQNKRLDAVREVLHSFFKSDRSIIDRQTILSVLADYRFYFLITHSISKGVRAFAGRYSSFFRVRSSGYRFK